MPERPQRLIDRDANRRAVQFTQRDDVRDFARSGIGKNYHRMMDLQSQNNPNLQDLKQSRRQWNRYDKYNAGRMLGKSPTEMQDMFSRDTEVFRQRNNPAYTKMYPVTGNFMNVADKGGIWGAMLSNFLGGKGKEIKKSIQSVGDRIGGGISNFIDDEKEKEEYAAKTFPFYPSDMHPGTYDIYDRPEDLGDYEDDPDAPIKRMQEEVYGGPRPHEGMPTFPDIYWGPEPHRGLPPLDVYEGPRPHEGIPESTPLQEDTTKYEDYIERGSQEPLPFDEGKEDFIRRQNEYVAPIPAPLGTPDPQGDFDRFNEYPTPDIGLEFGEPDIPPIIPYEGREFGLGQFMNEMPGSMKSNWEDYLEHVGRLGDMPGGGKLTYDEWHDMMRRRR